MRSLHTTMQSSSRSPQLEKARAQQRTPRAAKNKLINLKKKDMGSKYILIIMVVALGPVIYYLLLLFIFPKCSVMSIYYLYNKKKSHI